MKLFTTFSFPYPDMTSLQKEKTKPHQKNRIRIDHQHCSR